MHGFIAQLTSHYKRPKMRKFKLLLLFSMILTSTELLNACSTHNKDKQNTLRVDIGGEPSSLDPALAQEGTSFRVINDLFAGLLDFNQKNQPIPGMAASFDTSPDGKTYTFHLRHDLKFSDGNAIYADDFVYSWRRLLDPKTGSAYNFILNEVKNADAIMQGKLPINQLGISAPDKYTIVVQLTHPSPDFLARIMLPAAFVVPKRVIKKFGNQWIDPAHVVTSGAYTLKEHIINGDILAVKNPYFYAANNVKIDQVKYFPFQDPSVSIANYKAGTLDTTWQTVPVDQFTKLKLEYPTQLHISPWERIEFLSYNFKLAKYANNANLRKALSLAIDRKVITNDALKSGQTPLYSIITPTIENGKYANIKYTWASWPRSQQIALSKKLYQEAGYSSSHPLEVTLSYRNNDLTKKIALSVAAMWTEVLGVKVKLANQEYRIFLQSLFNGDFDIAWSTWGADFNAITTYTPIYTCGNAYNYAHYCNAEYDNLVKQAAQSVDSSKQTALYQKALWLLLNQYSTIPLLEPSHQRLINPRVDGYDMKENYLDNVQSKWMSLSGK